MKMKVISQREIELIRHELMEFMETRFSEEFTYAKADSPRDITSIAKDLNDVCIRFERCQSRWKNFVPEFAEWEKKRILVIRKLEDLACELDSHKFKSNVAKLVGGSVGAVGGVLTIVGVCLAPFTFGASTPLIIAGSATAMAGGSTNIGTAITETVLIKKKTEEFHKLLEQHEKDTQCISERFQDAVEFVAAVNEVMDVQFFKQFIEGISYAVFGDQKGTSRELFDENSLKFLSSLISEQMLKMILPPPIVSILMFIILVPKLFNIMWRVVEIYNHNPLVFETVLITAKIGLQVARGIDLGVDTIASAISLARVSVSTANVLAKAVAHGTLAGVGLALDITSIILASKDVYYGSKSKHAEQMRKSEALLEQNLKYFSELREELCSE